MASHLACFTYCRLTSAEYEPLVDKEFELITLIHFLLALASSAYVSEVHTLDVNRVEFEQLENG